MQVSIGSSGRYWERRYAKGGEQFVCLDLAGR